MKINLQLFGGNGAKSSFGNAKDGGTTSEQDKTLKRIARKTANLKNEQLRIVDEDGNVRLMKQGNTNSVTLSLGEKRDLLPGAASIHNHPGGGTFSGDDLDDFASGVRAILVSTPEGVYKLTNANYDEPKKRYAGWSKMRDAMESSVKAYDSMLTLRADAMKARPVKRLADQMHRIESEWMSKRNAGASKMELDAVFARYDSVSEKYKTALKREMRRLEVEPFDRFYRKNAKKYGFEYSFVPW